MRKAKKISYIKKPFSRKSLICLPLAAVSLVCAGLSLGLSVRMQGQGGPDVAAWGLSSILFSVISLWYGLHAFLEKEMNYVLAKIGVCINGILLIFWFCLILVGLIR